MRENKSRLQTKTQGNSSKIRWKQRNEQWSTKHYNSTYIETNRKIKKCHIPDLVQDILRQNSGMNVVFWLVKPRALGQYYIYRSNDNIIWQNRVQDKWTQLSIISLPLLLFSLSSLKHRSSKWLGQRKGIPTTCHRIWRSFCCVSNWNNFFLNPNM